MHIVLQATFHAQEISPDNYGTPGDKKLDRLNDLSVRSTRVFLKALASDESYLIRIYQDMRFW